MEFQIISLLVIGGLLSIVGGFLTWKYADFFLARRDYYVNSKFDLLKKKISMSLSVAGTIIFLTILVASSLADKNKKQTEKSNKKATLKASTFAIRTGLRTNQKLQKSLLCHRRQNCI